MFRNMAVSLIRTVREDEDAENAARVPGRVVTTVAKAKELRPFVERLVTLAKKAQPHLEAARQYETDAERNSSAWKQWRESDQWQKWSATIAPAVALRRRAFSLLRDNEAVDILFDELGPRYAERPGGYTRVVQLATVRLGDAGKQALIEFVGERDRVRKQRSAPMVVEDEDAATEEAPADESAAEVEGAAETDETAEAAAAEGEADAGDEEKTAE